MSDELSIPSPTYRIPRQRRGLDPLTRKLALIACGVGGLLLVGIGGWTVLGHRNTAVPVVQAENGPIRVKPANPGGMQISGANEDIMSGGSKPGDGKLAPAPEAPNPQGLRAQTTAETGPRGDGCVARAHAGEFCRRVLRSPSQKSRWPHPTSMRPSSRYRNALLLQPPAR